MSDFVLTLNAGSSSIKFSLAQAEAGGAVIRAAGGEPHHITTMTWYFTDKAEYLANMKGLGEAYREVIGRHFPAMAAVQVVALVEDRAKIEIQAIAVVPE